MNKTEEAFAILEGRVCPGCGVVEEEDPLLTKHKMSCTERWERKIRDHIASGFSKDIDNQVARLIYGGKIKL